MGYIEVTTVIDEKKIAEVGKYPVGYIAHHIRCIAKTREMNLVSDTVDEEHGKHTLIYRTDYDTNPDAPFTAGFFASYVYMSPANAYLDTLSLFDSEDGHIEDCKEEFRRMDERYEQNAKSQST